jgi:hypothetical protein
MIAPTDPGLYFSPYNWGPTKNKAAMATINAGAYMKCMFSGSAATLHFDVSAMVFPPSQVYTRVDNGPLVAVAVAPEVEVSVPVGLDTEDVPWHTLELLVKATTETENRWTQGVNSTKVVFTGLGLDAGSAGVAAWVPAPRTILVFGDSISEGVLTLGGTATFDTDRNDASLVYSYRLGALLGAEVGVVGFGGSGLVSSGSGNVPPLPESWAWLWPGEPRRLGSSGRGDDVDPCPNLIALNEGTNDGEEDTVGALVEVLNGLLGRCPATPIALLRPFNGDAQATNLQAAAKGCADPGRVHYVDTAGFYNEALGGNLHPTGPNDVARVAPAVAAALLPWWR